VKFCEKCGSYMRETFSGFKCSRCGNEIHTPIVEIRHMNPSQSAPIDVVSDSEQNYRKVTKTCPRCGNPEAFSSIAFSSGEHAGVRQERSVERLTCTKCKHSWREN
jgi:DNA-directed RNA polymerase subunit M/transcription elongation factor TFIIS